MLKPKLDGCLDDEVFKNAVIKLLTEDSGTTDEYIQAIRVHVGRCDDCKQFKDQLMAQSTNTSAASLIDEEIHSLHISVPPERLGFGFQVIGTVFIQPGHEASLDA